MKKRILPALLALVMVVTMLPLAVFAADAGYTVTLTVYPVNEARGAYLSTYVTAKDNATPQAICITTARMAQWYWGNQAESKGTGLEAFSNPDKLYLHVGIAKIAENGAPVDNALATQEDGNEYVTFYWCSDNWAQESQNGYLQVKGQSSNTHTTYSVKFNVQVMDETCSTVFQRIARSWY